MVEVPPAAAGYARRSAVGIPAATHRQARTACAAVCHLACRCNQRAKNEKEGEHVVVGRAAGILMTVGRAAGDGHAAGGHAAGDAPTETARALSHGGGLSCECDLFRARPSTLAKSVERDSHSSPFSPQGRRPSAARALPGTLVGKTGRSAFAAGFVHYENTRERIRKRYSTTVLVHREHVLKTFRSNVQNQWQNHSQSEHRRSSQIHKPTQIPNFA
jgi:hypothetical protein